MIRHAVASLIHRHLTLPLVLLIAWAYPTILHADLASDVQTAIRQAKPGTTAISVCIIDVASGRRFVEINADRPMAPASNLKLVTTAAALSQWGPDFVYRTEFRLLEMDPQGHATVAVIGDGDPGFGDPKLLQATGTDVDQMLQLWVNTAQQAGIKQVARLLIDDRIFDREAVHPDWPKNQLGHWFCAQVSGLSFFDNCLDVYAVPRTTGQAPTIQVMPYAPFIPLSNRAVSGSGKPDFTVNLKHPQNELACSGYVKNRSLDPISTPVNDPAIFFGQVLAHRLTAANIPCSPPQRVAGTSPLPTGRALLVVRTSLASVLQRSNKDSQNLFAECLIKRLGACPASDSPLLTNGSWATGSQVIQSFLIQQLGRDIATRAIIRDGSGMSKENRVTTELLATLLQKMVSNPTVAQAYLNSLSIAGQDGTLQKRLKDNLRGEVYGKTGYIASVSSFSGVHVSPSGRRTAFSVLVNQFSANFGVAQSKALQDRIVRMIDENAP